MPKPKPMGDLDLGELRRLVEPAASKHSTWPLRVGAPDQCGILTRQGVRLGTTSFHEDARHVAAAVNALPALIAEVERLRGEAKRLGADREYYICEFERAAKHGGQVAHGREQLRARVAELESDVAILSKADETAESLHEENMALRERVGELEAGWIPVEWVGPRTLRQAPAVDQQVLLLWPGGKMSTVHWSRDTARLTFPVQPTHWRALPPRPARMLGEGEPSVRDVECPKCGALPGHPCIERMFPTRIVMNNHHTAREARALGEGEP